MEFTDRRSAEIAVDTMSTYWDFIYYIKEVDTDGET